MDASSVRVFDGTTDFRVWCARVENELMRYHLLGYVMVRGYDGSQSFLYNGEEVPPRASVINVDDEQLTVKEEASSGHNAAPAKGKLSRWDVLGESAEAKSILQRCLHPDVESAILNKNVYDSWKMLCSLYGNRVNPGAHDVHEMHRVLHHIRLGDKKGESVREFITRWEMLMQQYALSTGIEMTDGFRSVSLAQTLPSAWRRMVTSWRGIRPFVPFAELVEKIIVARERQAQVETASVPSSTSVKATQSLTDSSLDMQITQLPERSAGKSAGTGVQTFVKPPQKVGNESAEDHRKSMPASVPAEKMVEKPVKHRTAEASVIDEAAPIPRKAVPPRIDAKHGGRDTVDLTRGDALASSSGRSKSVRSRSMRRSSIGRSDGAATPRTSKSPRNDDRHERTDGYDSRDRYITYDSERASDKHASSSRYDKSSSSWKPHDRYEKKYDSYIRFDNKGSPVSCFYCLKLGHHMKRCWYLKDDIENGTTHDHHKKFSCAVTGDRNPFMVSCLDAYIDEVNRERDAYGTTSRSHGDYDVSESVGRAHDSQHHHHHHQQQNSLSLSAGQPSGYSFHEHRPSSSAVFNYRKRSNSEYQIIDSSTSSWDPRLNRSRSVYRSSDLAGGLSPRKRSRLG